MAKNTKIEKEYSKANAEWKKAQMAEERARHRFQRAITARAKKSGK